MVLLTVLHRQRHDIDSSVFEINWLCVDSIIKVLYSICIRTLVTASHVDLLLILFLSEVLICYVDRSF